jgi:hypothetical protein
MKSTAFLFVPLVTAAVLGPPLGQERATRSASLPHLSVKVSLARTSGGQLMLAEEFTTDSPYQHSVICASAIYDMEYLLRDSSGKAISKSVKARDMPVWSSGQNVVGPANAARTPDPCKTIGANREERVVALSDLYPHLAHGSYTLRVTLAPRDSHERAVLAPPLVIRM